MSNIEMQHSNAILAISSLDRFISTSSELESFIEASWLVATPTILTLTSGVPIVGSKLFSNGTGFPVVPNNQPQPTILSVVGAQITISIPVTANSGVPASIVQVTTTTSAQQPVSNALIGQYKNLEPHCNNFTISSPGALIYGYISKIIVSQIQLQYNIPTICQGRNDTLVFEAAGFVLGSITIPFGFYTPTELAAAIQGLAVSPSPLSPLGLTVTYNLLDGFTFASTTVAPAPAPINFSFPSPELLLSNGYTQQQIDNVLKTYRTFGINESNDEKTNQPTQRSYEYPNFLYTPYIDIYSDVLTNYQNIKDNNTSIAKPKGLIARVLLSGVGNPQFTTETFALGCSPFVMTVDLNSPKIIRWTPDVAVPSIDFQLRDCYGDFIPGDVERYPTEFQMTLLCVEDER
jgi:hypothetical protein